MARKAWSWADVKEAGSDDGHVPPAGRQSRPVCYRRPFAHGDKAIMVRVDAHRFVNLAAARRLELPYDKTALAAFRAAEKEAA